MEKFIRVSWKHNENDGRQYRYFRIDETKIAEKEQDRHENAKLEIIEENWINLLKWKDDCSVVLRKTIGSWAFDLGNQLKNG